MYSDLSSHTLFTIACVVTALTLFVMGAVKVRAWSGGAERIFLCVLGVGWGEGCVWCVCVVCVCVCVCVCV